MRDVTSHSSPVGYRIDMDGQAVERLVMKRHEMETKTVLKELDCIDALYEFRGTCLLLCYVLQYVFS